MINYRTIEKCYEMILNEDKDSAITVFFIRKLCQQDKVRTIKVGVKTLVDYDSLMKYLETA